MWIFIQSIFKTYLFDPANYPAKSQIFPSGVGGDQNRAKRRVNVGLTFIMLTETQLQMNRNAALCLLDLQLIPGVCVMKVVVKWPKRAPLENNKRGSAQSWNF